LKAIILAGGKGKRLQAISDVLPKPLMPINGIPILSSTLNSLKQSGIVDVAIVTGHHGDLIRRFAGDGGDYGVKITYYEQVELIGSGHAVLQAIEFVDEPVMVIAGDTAFSSAHLEGLSEFHREMSSDVSLCLKRLPTERLASTSSVQLGDDHRILSFVEKPQPGKAPSNLSAALLHIYPANLGDYLNKVSLSVRGEYELTEVINMMIADGLRVMGKEFPLPPDITDARDFLRLNFPYVSELVN